jgi:ubiquinone/menaquinone biosynthesis C-methylase UbiE
MDASHEFKHQHGGGQEPHAHEHQGGHGHGHGHGAADSSARAMHVMAMLSHVFSLDKWTADYRTKRLIPVSNGLIAASVIALAASIGLWVILPVEIKGIGIGLTTLAGLWVIVLFGAGATIMLLMRHVRSEARQMMLDTVSWQGTEQVLDVACGTGMILNGAARKLTTGKAVGIDMWEQTIGGSSDVLMTNARAEGVADRVEYRKMDALKLDFADGSFNVVTSSFALHHIGSGREDTRQAVAEMVRVLDTGGTLTLVDIAPMIDTAVAVLARPDIQITRREGMPLFHMVTARKIHATMHSHG